jgi:iron complex outermembrane recepter protein
VQTPLKRKFAGFPAQLEARDCTVTNPFLILNRARLSAGAASAVIGIALLAAPAIAQDQPAEEEEVGTITVTGSRVARPNAESPSPITTVGSDDIKEFGATKIEDLSNSLPQVFAGQSSGVSNGADGTATVDLRGLGPSRTVVLIDGKRLMPGNIGGGAGADLNFIPASLISSVDLLTGGASAAYGADAVAGVVNFKMNRKFQGIRLDAQYGFYQHTNNGPFRDTVNRRFTAPEGNTVTGGAYDASIAFGSGFNEDRGSFVAYAGYRSESAITQDKYDFSICTLNPTTDAVGNVVTTAPLLCGGSGTPARARFGGFAKPGPRTQATDDDGGLLFLDANGEETLINTGTPSLDSAFLPGSRTLLDNNSTIPYSGARDGFNFAPSNYFRRPSQRYIAGAFAEYEINPAIVPYLDVMFMDYSTQAQIAPSGAFFGGRTVNCDNPLLLRNADLASRVCLVPGTNLGDPTVSVLGTPTQVPISIGKRNIEGGPRFNDIGYNQFRIVTGLKGDLGDAWSYDAYFQTGQITVANTYRNDVSDARIDRALNVVNVGGVPTCQSVVDGTDPACVPYNVFNAGGITSAAANYLNIPLVITGRTRETVVQGTVRGDLSKYGIKSPLSDDGVRVSFGVEYRTESLETQPDASYIAGDGAGQGGPTLPINGKYTVTDFFSEVGLPLVTDKPFFHDLSLELGYRNSSYNVRGAADQNKANTFKIAGNWSPIPDFTLRASYNRAVRSPNIAELFLNQSIGLFAGADPCAGPAVGGLVNGNTAAQCARTGLTPGQFGNLEVNTANQYNQFSGGNLNLKPEKANTFSAGFILNPKAGVLSGLLVSVDYFNIKVNNAVGTIGSQTILNQCIITNDPFLCGKINRAPASLGALAGSLWQNEAGFVDNQTINTGSIKTSGIDINADYRTSIGSNKLRWQFVGTYLKDYVFQPITNQFTYDCAGYYGITCGNPNPEYRFNTNIKFTTASDFGLTVRWRHLSAAKNDVISPDPDLNSPASAPRVDDRIKAHNYFDLLFSLPIKDSATLRIGVNNVFDVDPPIVSQSSLGGFGNGNTFPGTYDQLGRNIFVNLTADF